MSAEVKKISWSDLVSVMMAHTSKVHYVNDVRPVRAVVVFDPDKSKWKKREGGYPLEARSYSVSSEDKFWHGECGGSSLFAYCLDKNECDSMGVRLDWYLDDWVIDYCYITDEGGIADDGNGKGVAK